MRKIMANTFKLLLVAFVIISSTALYAQPPGGGGQAGGQQGPPPIPNTKQIKKMVSKLTNKLSLTDEQETKISILYTKHFDQLKEKTSGNARPKREEMEALTTKFENKVKNLLNEKQTKKYIAYLKKNKPQKRRR